MGGGGGVRVLMIMTSMRKLCTKRVHFSGLRYIKYKDLTNREKGGEIGVFLLLPQNDLNKKFLFKL